MIDLLRECRVTINAAKKLYDALSLGPLAAAAKYGPDWEPPDEQDMLNIRQMLDDTGRRLDAALAGKDGLKNAAPQSSTAEKSAAPSQEGVGQGEVAVRHPGLPEEPYFDGASDAWRFSDQKYHRVIDAWDAYAKVLRTLYLRAVKERDDAWAAVREAFCGVGSHDAAAWEKKHAATIAAARGGGDERHTLSSLSQGF